MKKILAVLLASATIIGGVSAMPVSNFTSITAEAATTVTTKTVTTKYCMCVGDTFKSRLNGQFKLTSTLTSGLSLSASYNTSTNKTLLTVMPKAKGTYTFTGVIGNDTYKFSVVVEDSRTIYTGDVLNFNIGSSSTAKSISTSNNNVIRVGVSNGKISASTVSAGTATVKIMFTDGSSYITNITVKQKYIQVQTCDLKVNGVITFKQATNNKGYSVTNNGVLSLTTISGGCKVKGLKAGTAKLYVNIESGTILIYTIVVK